MTKSILKVILLCVIYATSNTVYCQTDWQSYQTQKPLPEKAKMKTVKYKSYGYAAVGYVIDKQFVEGQSITFYSTKTETVNFFVDINNTELTNPRISGIYFVKDGISYLASTIKREDGWSNQNYSIQLIFKVNNTFDGKRLTIKPDEAKELSIETADIVQCLGSYESGNFPFQIHSNPNDYVLKIGYYDKILEVTITLDYLKKTFFPTLDNLIKNKKSSSEGQSISFDFDDYINNSSDVKLTYKDKGVFVGKVENGLSSSDGFIPNEGKYTFPNGETVIGKCIKYQKRWEDGEWEFTDGSIENGNWLEKYGVSVDDLSSAETLTDKHKLAIRIYEENQQKLKHEEIAKQQEEEKKQITKQERKNNLISKYGEKWANLILLGKFTIGMTKEMMQDIKVGEVMGGDNNLAVEYAYEKSISTSSGQRVEIWELNRQISREWKNMTILGINAYDFNAPKFPTLVFTKGKLTDIYR